jgi:hypothetical protein
MKPFATGGLMVALRIMMLLDTALEALPQQKKKT